MRRVGKKRNDNFYFISFSSISYLFLAWNEAIMVFFKFLNFFAIFLEFSISRQVGTKRNGTIIIIFSLSRPFHTYFAWKKAIMVFFNFLNFFTILLEFSITRRVGTEGTDSFYFFSFSAFSNLFWLEMKQ